MGVLEQPTRKSRTLLTRALACLFADGHIGTGGSFPPFIRHLVVAGWSSGTDSLFKWVPIATPKASDLVNEFWVFDGKRGFPVDLEGWLRNNPKRRLRLIGTAYTFRALSDPAGGQGPLRFRSGPQAPREPNDASDWSNIYLERDVLVDNGISVEHSLTLFSPGLGRATLSNISHEEAATLIVLNFLAPYGRSPVTSAAEFNEAVQSAISVSSSEPQESFRHRHPWSVFGGFFNRSGKPFLGYFQICLEQSGF